MYYSKSYFFSLGEATEGLSGANAGGSNPVAGLGAGSRSHSGSPTPTIVSPINKACTNYPEIKVEKKKSVKLGILVEDH